MGSSISIFRWIHKSVGTIHTFQGKQTDMVILLLGGNPQKLGAIEWVASTPNMLNVAVTRAKNLVLVVGNHAIWSKKNYFQELASITKLITPTDMQQVLKRQ